MKRHDYGRRLEKLGKALQDGDTTLGELGRLADECGLGVYFKEIVCKEQEKQPWIRRGNISNAAYELALKVARVDKEAADYLLSRQVMFCNGWTIHPTCLMDSFCWDNTPQGLDFWQELDRKVRLL